MIDHFYCVIVDDERDAIELLETRLNHLYKNIEIQQTYTHWEEAFAGLRNYIPDILFIDISMPEKTGFDLLKLLPDMHCEIIFTTSYSEFAIDAFNFSASDYLLKPIGDVELTRAVNKATERIRNEKLAKQHYNTNKLKNPKIGIPNNNGIDYISIDEIIYFESINKYTKIVTEKTKLISSYYMRKFKIMLEGALFYQVHRSYIVNLTKIVRYESSSIIIMSDGTQIPLARNEKARFLSFYSTITNAKIAEI